MCWQELLERHAVLQSPSRIEELVKIFIHATKVSRPIVFKYIRYLSISDGDRLLGYGSGRKVEDNWIERYILMNKFPANRLLDSRRI